MKSSLHDRSLSSDGSGPGRGHVDAADAVVVVFRVGDLNVTAFTPSCSPRVSDDPVLEVVGLTDTIADNSDGMVGRFQAGRRVENSTYVGLERELSGIDTDSNG